MIEILNGVKETVTYPTMNCLKLYHNNETENYPPHWHIAFEIIMTYKNDYTAVIRNETIHIEEGDILLISPGELHSLFAPPTGERMIAQCDCSIFQYISGMDSMFHMFCPYVLIKKNGLQQDLNRQLTAILLKIDEEYSTPKPFVEASVYSMLTSFLVLLGRNQLEASTSFPNTTTNKQHEYMDKFMAICNYINDHCTENISVDDLAVRAGYSKFHFSRLFKQFTGISCYEYITKQRLSLSEKLLLTPDLSIADVAMQSGFNSLSSFNRTFKQNKHCTPREYKQLGSD